MHLYHRSSTSKIDENDGTGTKTKTGGKNRLEVEERNTKKLSGDYGQKRVNFSKLTLKHVKCGHAFREILNFSAFIHSTDDEADAHLPIIQAQFFSIF